jgi:hypothetical protein
MPPQKVSTATLPKKRPSFDEPKLIDLFFFVPEKN